MKSNRKFQLVLLAIIVVFVAAAGFLYMSNSSQLKRKTQITDNLSKSQATYNSGLAQKAALAKTATDLASQLASAKASLAQIHFRSSSESVEYDRILYSIADAAALQLTSLSATAPADVHELNNTYQLTTFSLTVEGLSPDGIFSSPGDDTAYNDAVVKNILDFMNKISTSPDFDTANIQSVNISVPKTMTGTDIQTEIDGINTRIAAEIKTQIDALAAQIQADNAGGTLTQDQINTLIKTETAQLVATTLAAKTADEVKALVEQANIATPSATITINIWTYKGA